MFFEECHLLFAVKQCYDLFRQIEVSELNYLV